uniref:Legume lectin domain-containing protein n=1 Tax=Populus davidiana TaxID=266767 RepID=A0A6M2EGQ3_9ROSI
MSKISNSIVFMLLHGLIILTPPPICMVQAYDTAEYTHRKFPHKLKAAYPLGNMRGINIMLALDSSDRESGTVKIASTEHFTAEVKVKPDKSRRVGTPKLSSPKPNTRPHYRPRIFPPPPPPPAP